MEPKRFIVVSTERFRITRVRFIRWIRPIPNQHIRFRQNRNILPTFNNINNNRFFILFFHFFNTSTFCTNKPNFYNKICTRLNRLLPPSPLDTLSSDVKKKSGNISKTEVQPFQNVVNSFENKKVTIIQQTVWAIR